MSPNMGSDPRPSVEVNTEEFATFSLNFAKLYLTAGGPSSRVEEELVNLGRKFSIQTDVWATPTGAFICCRSSQRTTSLLARVKEGTMNLSHICWLEELIHDVSSGKISIKSAQKILTKHRFLSPVYALKFSIFAAWLMGFSIAMISYGSAINAIFAGFITCITFWIAGPGMKNLIPSSIFRDFLACCFALISALLCQKVIYFLAPSSNPGLASFSIEALSVGGILLLVPGLTLTTAISELADQNFLSGTSKLMKGVLTLVSMGTAFLLLQEFNPVLAAKTQFTSLTEKLSLQVSLFFNFLSVLSFGILFQVPKKALPWAALTGTMGWLSLTFLEPHFSFALSSFLASMIVGLLSSLLGMRFRTPSQIYSVPGILALLPGMLALSSFRTLAAGSEESAIEIAFRVTVAASSIVFGLFFARTPILIIQNIQKISKRTQEKLFSGSSNSDLESNHE